jgi:hypothetical protein
VLQWLVAGQAHACAKCGRQRLNTGPAAAAVGQSVSGSRAPRWQLATLAAARAAQEPNMAVRRTGHGQARGTGWTRVVTARTETSNRACVRARF